MRTSIIAFMWLCGAASPLVSQSPSEIQRRLRESQRELQAIRGERDRLQTDLQQIRARAFTISEEISNLERQRQATGRLVNELDRQLINLDQQVNQATRELILAENAFTEKQAISERRLIEIYKRGPLHDVQVLLAAESFGDLLSRYKYLFLVSRQDRRLTEQMEQLRNDMAASRLEIVDLQGRIGARRNERTVELDRYRELERQRAANLRETRRAERSTETQLATLSADEQRIANVIASLESARGAAEARGAGRAGTITDADLGRLSWPLEGGLLYRFGPAQAAGGGNIRWTGIGIQAAPGTEVRAVRNGRVQIAEQLGTFRTMVIIDHGGGYYTLYAALQDASVIQGQDVVAGQVVGRVSEGFDDIGPRLHFEIRGPGGLPLDPLTWLTRR